MRKLWIVLLGSLLLLALVSCSGARNAGKEQVLKEKAYTRMEASGSFDTDEPVLGLSPDGKLILTYNLEEIHVYDADSKKLKKSIPYKGLPSSKKALFNPSGDQLVTGDSSCFPQELALMKSMNFKTYDLEKGKARTITDQKVEDGYFDGGVLIYAPSWSADSKGILFSAMETEGTKLIKTDIGSGDETVLMKSERKGLEGIELKDGLLLCEYNGPKAGDIDLFLYDVKAKKRQSLTNVLENEPDTRTVYEIKSYSKDRKKVLINKWVPASAADSTLVLQKCLVLHFDSSFKKYDIETISFGIDAEADDTLLNPLLKNKNGRNTLAHTAVLSPGGRYIITREDVMESVDKAILPKTRQLVLYDLEKDETHILYQTEDQEPFGVNAPINGGSQAIFMSENGKLLVWFMNGYKLYDLKP